MNQSAQYLGRVFALTGGIGSGKSSAARCFVEAGVPVVDADKVARQVVEKGSPALSEIERKFGKDILTTDGVLDRAALGKIVFAEPEARAALNSILHPRIRTEVQRQLEELLAQGAPLVCYDIPLLFETAQADRFRPVVVVSADEDVRVRRIVARDGLSEADARARILAQMPLAEKVSAADVVLENNGTPEELQRAALLCLSEVKQWIAEHSA